MSGGRTGFIREFTWLAASNQLAAVGSVVAMIVLARMQNVETLGRVAFAQSFAALLLLIVDVRFEDAIQRYFPQIDETQGRRAATAYYWRLCRWDFALGLGVLGLSGLVWATQVSPGFSTWDSAFVALSLGGAGVAAAAGSLNAAYAVSGELSRLARVSGSASLCASAFSILGTFIAGGTGFLVGAMLGGVLQIALLLRGALRLLPPAQCADSYETPGGLRAFILKSSIGTSLAVGGDSGVLAVFGALASPALVGTVKVAMAPARMLQTLMSPLSAQLFPRLSVVAARRDWTAVRGLTRDVTRTLIAPLVVVTLAAAGGVYWLLVPLYGAAYASAVPLALLLLLAAAFRACVSWGKVLPLATGRPGLRLIVLAVDSALMMIVAVAASLTGQSFGLLTFGLGAVTIALGLVTFWLGWVQRLLQAKQMETV